MAAPFFATRTAIALLGISSIASAQTQPPLLHHLSAGSTLVVLEPILIRANDTSVRFTPEAGANGTVCTLWMEEAKPYDRLISKGKELSVVAVRRNGFSYRSRMEMHTAVILDSESIQDISCRNERSGQEPSLAEFSKAVGTYFEVRQQKQRPIEIS